jgi:hypothetical protein
LYNEPFGQESTMTVDHLPLSIVELVESTDHTDSSEPMDKVDGTATRQEKAPPPPPETEVEADDNWQQSGFGSFP